MDFARVLRFARHGRNQRRLPRRRSRLLHAPWQPLAVLLGVVGVAWFAAALQPSITGENVAHMTHGNGTFVLCASASRPNCVVDGDTIRYGGVKIRLADIDAPEVFSPQCTAEGALGRRATGRLLELMNAGPFELVRAGDRDEDRYGRKLRTIERNGRSVGHQLVAEGLARRWDGGRRSWCGCCMRARPGRA